MVTESGLYVRRAVTLLSEAQQMARAAGAIDGFEGAAPANCPFDDELLRFSWHRGRTLASEERRP